MGLLSSRLSSDRFGGSVNGSRVFAPFLDLGVTSGGGGVVFGAFAVRNVPVNAKV